MPCDVDALRGRPQQLARARSWVGGQLLIAGLICLVLGLILTWAARPIAEAIIAWRLEYFSHGSTLSAEYRQRIREAWSTPESHRFEMWLIRMVGAVVSIVGVVLTASGISR